MYIYIYNTIPASEWCFENQAKRVIDSSLFSVKLINTEILDLEKEKNTSSIEMDPGIDAHVI